MDRLEKAWTRLTITSLPGQLSDVSDLLHTFKGDISLGFLATYVTARIAEATTAEDVVKSSKLPSEPGLSTEHRDILSRLTTHVVRLLHLDIPSAALLVDDCVKSRGENLAGSTAKGFDDTIPSVIEFHFKRRSLILGVIRFIFESSRNVGTASSHPLQGLFQEFVENVVVSEQNLKRLVDDFAFLLARLQYFAEKPDFSSWCTKWLLLQLQDLRDQTLLLFDLSGFIPKDRERLEDIFDSVLQSAVSLQRFPISPDSKNASLQVDLLQQLNTCLTAFVFRYFSNGTPIFLRDDGITAYLEKTLPKGSSVALLGPASVLYLISRLEVDAAHQPTIEILNKYLSEGNPFYTLCLLLRFETIRGEMKEVLAGLVNDFGEQFLRMFGLDVIGEFRENFYDLAAGVFHHPREVNRFWQRWSDGAGTDLAYPWGNLVGYTKDQLPRTLMSFTTIMTSLLKGFAENLGTNQDAVRILCEKLWTLDSFVEELPEEQLRELTLLRSEMVGGAVVRTDRARYPFDADTLVIPANTLGWTTDSNRLMDLKWILHDENRYSIWTLLAVKLDQILANSASFDGADSDAAMDVTVKIGKFYSVAVKVDSSSHDDLKPILASLCRIYGRALQFAVESGKLKQQHSVMRAMFDLCSAEVSFRGVQLLHDLDFVASSLLPKATSEVSSKADWIRNGNATWFSPTWQELARNSSQKDFARTLGKLASAMESAVKTADLGSSSDPVLQMCNLYLLNIGLQFVVQLDELVEGIPVLKYVLSVVSTSGASDTSVPTMHNVALDCLYEGPAGQALLELIGRGSRLINLQITNDVPTTVFDVERPEEVHFVQLVLEILSKLLKRLPVRPSSIVTALERSLLSTDRSRHLQTVSVVNPFAQMYSHPKHPALQLVRYITTARDAKVVEFACAALSGLVTLQQPSLTSLARDQAEEFLLSVFRLLKQSNTGVNVELWKFLALCDTRQPRLLDLFINLEYSAQEKKYKKDIQSIPCLLDIVLEVLEHPPADQSDTAVLEFCVQLFGSGNDYAEYLATNESFWKFLLDDILPKAALSSVPWEKKAAAICACDLLSLELIRRPQSVLKSGPFVDYHWIPYVSEHLPNIFRHLNKDVTEALRSWEDDSVALRNVSRFFSSWSALNLLVFRQDALKETVTAETRQNVVRITLVLLSRSLTRSSTGLFMNGVASALLDMLYSWRASLPPGFFVSVLRIVEDLVVSVCGKAHWDDWSDEARRVILDIAAFSLDLIISSEESSAEAVEPKRIKSVFMAAVDVILMSAMQWNMEDDTQEQKAVMLGSAFRVLSSAVRLATDGSDFTVGTIADVFRSQCLYEVLVTKALQLLKFRKHPRVAQGIFNLLLFLSGSKVHASSLGEMGFARCCSIPLAGLLPFFKELLVERNIQSSTIDDVVASKSRLADAQEFFEVYLAGLSVQFSVMRRDRQRFSDSVKFVGAQLLCLPEVLDALQSTPTVFTFRLVELLTGLMAEISRHGTGSLLKQACLSSVPAIFHSMCGQLMRQSDLLKENWELLASTTTDLILSTAISCLQVLNATNPGVSALLTDEEFLSENTDVKMVLDFSFGNPVSRELSPSLSFGTVIHVIRLAIDVLSKVNPADVAAVVFSTSAVAKGKFWKMIDFLERCADFFLYQTVAFTIGLSGSTGDSWSETSRELNNEIGDLRHALHTFLDTLEENLEGPVDLGTKQSLLSLVTQMMAEFRIFHDALKDDLYEPRSHTPGAAPRSDRKKVTFALS